MGVAQGHARVGVVLGLRGVTQIWQTVSSLSVLLRTDLITLRNSNCCRGLFELLMQGILMIPAVMNLTTALRVRIGSC